MSKRLNCRLSSVICAGLIAGLGGCATLDEPTTAAAAPQPPATVAASAPAAIEYGNFTEEQLYQAIISELGAQRGQVADAGDNYFKLAFATRDLAVIQRAVQFASVTNDLNALLQLGLLWAEVSPQDPQPHLLLSFQFLESGNFDEALSHMARVIDLGGEIDFSALSNRTGQLSAEARSGLINNLQLLREEYPEQVSIQLAVVRMMAQNQQFDAALAQLQSIKRRVPADAAIVVLESQLYASLENPKQALRTLRSGVKQFPDNKDLRLTYARLLIQEDDYPAAQTQFSQMMQQDPQDWETQYSIALLDLEMENYADAIAALQRLVDANQRVDESQFYLGYAFEQQGDLPQSIEHYRQVRIGTTNFLAAQQQATHHAIALGNLDAAHQWLVQLSQGQPRLEVLFTTVEAGLLQQAGYARNAKTLLDTALNRFPNDADLLFQRVLYFDSTGDLAGAEKDLRQIILMQPEDAQALNHLGYMLADQTDRHEEALALLERAIAINPDDPAIIDSLAWAQYKLGKYDDALANLRRAFAAFPDHEVASHLGEVLWAMGRHDEANQVWQAALKETPDSDIIKEAMTRLQAS